MPLLTTSSATSSPTATSSVPPSLFSLDQSGAINESVADTIGEVIDHRNGTRCDSAWTIGEALPGGAIRSMKDPPLFGQPDKMTSTTS